MTDHERYERAAHAMQSGVQMEIDENNPSTTPKHLRVGINSCLCDQAALARLLIEKGVFTETEYLTALADEMEREKARYEERLSAKYGAKITLA